MIRPGNSVNSPATTRAPGREGTQRDCRSCIQQRRETHHADSRLSIGIENGRDILSRFPHVNINNIM
jgi:hypothetical protein